MARRARGARKPPIARENDGLEHLGERHVDGVVDTQVVSKLPDSFEQRLVSVALEVQGTEIFERDRGGERFEFAIFRVPSKGLGDLEVREVRYMKTAGRISDARGDGLSYCRLEQQFTEPAA